MRGSVQQVGAMKEGAIQQVVAMKVGGGQFSGHSR